MSMLVHFTVKVTGDSADLARFDERLKLLFVEQVVVADIEESHSSERLWYDLKVEGGIPFPPFALASQEFPGLTLGAEWVNPASGVGGAATIVGGKVTESRSERGREVQADEAVHFEVTRRGYLELAAAFYAANRDEYLGYVANGDRDAVFRLARGADGVVELDTTDGAPEWSLRWRIEPGDAQPVAIPLDPQQPIPAETWQALEALAQRFATEWLWLGDAPQDEVAIERDRYRRYGLEPFAANLRSAVLHRMMTEAPEGADRYRMSTVRDDERWVVEVLEKCWQADR